MRRLRIAVAVLAAAWLVPPAPAWAGGTLVIAPPKLDAADCEPGRATRFQGFDAGAFALGCVFPTADRGVLLAADRNGGFACFYIAPAGAGNEGPCAQLRPGARFASPVSGAPGLTPLTIGRYGRDVYLAGWASPDVRRVVVRGHPSGKSLAAAELLPVGATELTRLGGRHPFSIFVARIPQAANTCGGIEVVGTTAADDSYRAEFRRSDRAWPSEAVPLPGTRECEMSAAIATAMAFVRRILAGLSVLPTA